MPFFDKRAQDNVRIVYENPHMTPLARLFWSRDNYFLSQDLRNDTKKSWVAYKLVFKNYLKISDFEWLIF